MTPADVCGCVVVAVVMVASTAPSICHVAVDGRTAVDTSADIQEMSRERAAGLPAEMVAYAK